MVAGFSIGSLGKDGMSSSVEEVRVQNCHLKGTMYGARIKTWQVFVFLHVDTLP